MVKQKKNRRIKTIIVIILISVIGLGLWVFLKDGISISGKTIQGKDMTVIDYFNGLAGKYGFSFTKITNRDDDVYAFSKDFDQLSDLQKTLFFREIDESIVLSGQELTLIPKSGWGGWPHFFVVSQGHRYSIEDETNNHGYVELFDLSLAGTGEDSTIFQYKTKDITYSGNWTPPDEKESYAGNYHSSDAKLCQSCNRYFEDSTNKNYIAHTNMCKNCYQNFCWATGKTPKNYDK